MENAAQRTVSVAIYTRAGWISGNMHLGADEALVDHLNIGGSFFRLTDVQLASEEAPREFFAMHAGEASLVLPLEVGEQFHSRESKGETIWHDIACVLAEGTLFCGVELPVGIRVSDHLMTNTGFIPIRRCLVPVMELPTSVSQPIELAYLNTARIIGVAETHPMQADTSREFEMFTEA